MAHLERLRFLSVLTGLVFYFWLGHLSETEAAFLSSETPGVIIRYHAGQSPDELAQKTRARLERGTSFFGRLANLGEDLVTTAQNQDLPEVALQGLKDKEKEAGVAQKRSLVAAGSVLGANSKGKQHPLANLYFADLLPGTRIEQSMETLRQDPRVKYVNPTHKLHASRIPNDPEFGQLWGLDNTGQTGGTVDADIDAPEAWEITTGSAATKVAVLDSGVNLHHQDLEGNISLSHCDGVCDFVNLDNDPQDDHQDGHGTFVAGLIGARGDNEVGITGVNWEVAIMPYKVLDAVGEGDETTIFPAIISAVDHGAKVINMSFSTAPGGGGPCTDERTEGWREVIAYARDQGVVLVAAVGNDDLEATETIPANCDHVVGVGATNDRDERASFSNYGSVVDLSAPGTNIYSLNNESSAAYVSGSGTSFAAPHVSGAAALLLAKNNSLTPEEVKNILLASADSIQTDQPIGPRLNLKKALDMTDNPPTITPTPTATPTPTPAGGPVEFLLLAARLQGINTKAADRDFLIELTSESIPLASQEVRQTVRFVSDENGIFAGILDLAGENLDPGGFSLKISTSHHLRRRFNIGLNPGPNILVFTDDSEVLFAGDLEENGTVNTDDRDILIESYRAFAGAVANAADLDESGYINAVDYSILVNNLGCQNDDQPGCGRQPPALTPTPTPTTPPVTPTPTATPTLTPTPTPPQGLDTSYDINVLVIKYFPLTADGQNIDIEVTGDVGESYQVIRRRTVEVTNALEEALENASTYLGYSDPSAEPALRYQIVETAEHTEAVPIGPRSDRPKYADYAKIMTDHQICDYVDNQNVSEVWLWAYQGPGPHLDIDESKMAGPHGDISNSYRYNDLPVCSQTYRLYTFNYGRATAEALESWGHQFEAELDAVDQELFRNVFQGPPHPQASGETGRCGSVHNPPNAGGEYDWANPNPHPSDCLDWNPDGPDGLGTLSDISCNQWGCENNDPITDNASLNYQVWNWQNLPGRNNRKTYQLVQLRNWWDVHGQLDTILTDNQDLKIPF